MIETRPSGAHRWTRCAAAPSFAAKCPPQPDSDPAREGTCAAWVAEMVLTGQATRCADLIGTAHSNGWEVDAEMAGHVQGYVDTIHADGGFISAERHVRLSQHVAGTLDSCSSLSAGILKVRDFKYGFRLVESDAPQLVIYAGALLSEVLNVQEIHTEIYQPRGFHPDGIHRRTIWTPGEIRERCNQIAIQADKCHQPNPVATPGPHCLDCTGAAGCAALAATSVEILATVEDTRHRHMTADEMAQRLAFLRHAKKTLDAAASAVEAEALERHKTGEHIPGWSIKERLGHSKFTAGRGAIRALTGIDPVKEAEMSPAELKAAGATKEQLAVLTHRPVIGHKIAPNDTRDLARQFKGVDNG